ncbi:MAG: ABC transporter permease [Myxococcales bacterium]|nr:ABC transporter permease [Myxococcales bacterium]MCB9708998.1 ABC transporter permease [Myxococcales bacterium]
MTDIVHSRGGLRSVARLEWLRLSRSRHISLSILASAAVLIIATAMRYVYKYDAVQIYDNVLSAGVFGMLAYLLPFLFASGTISEELEGRTFPFLLTRPTRRSTLLLGKLVVTSAASATLLVVSLVALHAIMFLFDAHLFLNRFPMVMQQAASVGLLACCYCAVCLFWGAIVPRASGIACALHLAVLEFGAGYILPGSARLISLGTQARKLAGLPDRGFFQADLGTHIPVWGYAGIMVLAGVLFTGAAVLIFQHREFSADRA